MFSGKQLYRWPGVLLILVVMAGRILAQTHFGTATISPAFEIDGAGNDIDTITFWEAPDPNETLMFVSAKASQLVEVWKVPFVNNEQEPLRHSSFGSGTRVNGVVFDQERGELYVATSKPASTVSVFSYPGGQFVREFINGARDLRSEPNIDLYFRDNGERWAYVTADNIVYVYNGETGEELFNFKPATSVETVLADEFYNLLYVPDEKTHQGIFVFNPDGTPFTRNGRQNFGDEGVFQSDEEGILLYTFPASGVGDDGSGYIVVSDQKSSATDFEFFDRETWEHLGSLQIDGVSNTDGIASTQRALPDYPLGLFVCINDDGTTVGVGWDAIFDATGLGDGGDGGSATAVSGLVLTAGTNAPLADATVQLQVGAQVEYETTSNASGFYTFVNIASGAYTLFASKDGFESWSSSIDVSDGQQLQNRDIFLAPTVDSTPPLPPGNVRVTVDRKND
ncbi:MAG: phytase [bacterium]